MVTVFCSAGSSRTKGISRRSISLLHTVPWNTCKYTCTVRTPFLWTWFPWKPDYGMFGCSSQSRCTLCLTGRRRTQWTSWTTGESKHTTTNKQVTREGVTALTGVCVSAGGAGSTWTNGRTGSIRIGWDQCESTRTETHLIIIIQRILLVVLLKLLLIIIMMNINMNIHRATFVHFLNKHLHN